MAFKISNYISVANFPRLKSAVCSMEKIKLVKKIYFFAAVFFAAGFFAGAFAAAFFTVAFAGFFSTNEVSTMSEATLF